ncbi:hypothetical protein JCM10908_000920 [Rhodotorula pacifica]|uniref:uncharacterized protein n=1 Tax=Rhodotorula pacifica TaxID=1495444 RepID=UPI00317A11CF
MGLRTLVRKLKSRLTCYESPAAAKGDQDAGENSLDGKRQPVRSAQDDQQKPRIDAQITTVSDVDGTESNTPPAHLDSLPTKPTSHPANLDSLPTELLLSIVEAVSPAWLAQRLLLVTLVQVNRKLAALLRSEARRTFIVSSRQPIADPCALPDELRAAVVCLLFLKYDLSNGLYEHSYAHSHLCGRQCGILRPEIQALLQHLEQHFPQLQAVRLCPLRVPGDKSRHALPGLKELPRTLRYICVECTSHTAFAPNLPESYFKNCHIPTLFHIDYAFREEDPPYTAHEHPMHYVQLDDSDDLTLNSALSDFLLALPSLRCIFIPQHWSELTGPERETIDSLVRDLEYKGVDVRHHAQHASIEPVLPEFVQYLRDNPPPETA